MLASMPMLVYRFGSRLLMASLLLVVGLTGVAMSQAQAGSTIKGDEEVLFFPTAAHRESGHWVAPIHGWIFEPEQGSIWRRTLVQSLRKLMQVKASEESFFRKRIRWFLVDNERGKKLAVRVSSVTHTLPASGADGHFRGVVRIPVTTRGAVAGSSIRVTAKTRAADARRFEGEVLLIAEKGISVISDIDDTIKVTGAYDRKLTLKRTFLQSFRAVPGMARVYRAWRSEGAAFHYVSASPWHLFSPLSSFMRRSAFPKGSLHLRNFRVKSSSRWNLLKSSKDYKLKAIEELLGRYPKRVFVLVGDTGESDPEIYSELAHKHPAQIRRIFLHLVRPEDMDERRLRATEGTHHVPVTVFTDAAVIATKLR